MLRHIPLNPEKMKCLNISNCLGLIHFQKCDAGLQHRGSGRFSCSEADQVE